MPAADGVPAPRSAVAASRAGIFLAAVALVAVLAGSALFFAGLLARPPVRADARARRRATRTPSSRSGTRTRRSPTGTRGATVDRKSLVEGAIKGMIGALDDPYSQYLTSRRVPVLAPGDLGPVRGHRRDDRHGRPGRAPPPSCTTLSDDCRLAVVAPLTGSPAREGRAAAGRRDRRRSTAPRSAGLTRGRRRGARSAAPRTRRSRCGSGAGRARRSTSRSCARSSSSPRSRRTPSPSGKVGYIKLAGFSDRAAERVRRRASRRRVGRGERAADRRPARQPRRVRHRGPRHRQRVPRRRPDLLAAGRRRQPDRDGRPARRGRHRPLDPARASSSTAAPRPRPRSSRARSTIADGRRWSARRRSARAPSSSGRSSRTTAAASGSRSPSG